MPTQTFFNLTDEKQQFLTFCALEEFAQYPYQQASLSKIAQKAGIAKGSMYQYFDNKMDLYRYVLHLAGEKKRSYLSDAIGHMDETPFFKLLRTLYVEGLRFARNEPLYAALATQFTRETDESLKKSIMGTNIAKSNQFFETLIDNAKAKGEVSHVVDTEMAALLISTASTALIDRLLEEQSYESIMVDSDRLFERVDRMFSVLELGLRPREATEDDAEGA